MVLAVGLGLANGPVVVGGDGVRARPTRSAQASGISNMGRYIGAAVLTAVTAAISNSVRARHIAAGESPADAWATAFGRASIGLAVFCAVGIALALLVGRPRRGGKPTTAEYVAAAAGTAHTVPTRPTA